jgi:RimJ/RimL family protein N-acetyltransferase
MIPLPEPALGDDRIELRPWGAAHDADALVAAWADPEIRAWAAVPEVADHRVAARWIAGEAERRRRGLAIDLVVIERQRPDDVVGEVGLSGFGHRAGGSRSAEIGYWVRSDRRGRGLATRSVGLVCAWAFEVLRLDVIVARIAGGNSASARVASAAGFRRRGPEVWVRASTTDADGATARARLRF